MNPGDLIARLRARAFARGSEGHRALVATALGAGLGLIAAVFARSPGREKRGGAPAGRLSAERKNRFRAERKNRLRAERKNRLSAERKSRLRAERKSRRRH